MGLEERARLTDPARARPFGEYACGQPGLVGEGAHRAPLGPLADARAAGRTLKERARLTDLSGARPFGGAAGRAL